jgi:peroxiredoxin
VQAIVINVKESKTKAARWGKALGFTLPILLDKDGKVATSYAPPDVLPVLPRDQVPIASNLIIDREGMIRFYSLLDSARFDAELVALTECLDELLKEEE